MQRSWLLLVGIAVGALVGVLLTLGLTSWGKVRTPQEVAAIIAGVFGLVGIATTAMQAYLGYLERKSTAWREVVFRAMSQFKGGTQERNIGISIIGHYWSRAPELEGVFVRVLTNQAIYIIAEGNSDRAHEFSNLSRIIALLESAKAKGEYLPFYNEVISELESKMTKESGPRVTKDVMKDWIQRLTPTPPD